MSAMGFSLPTGCHSQAECRPERDAVDVGRLSRRRVSAGGRVVAPAPRRWPPRRPTPRAGGARMSSARKRTWVAHAGSSTSTSSDALLEAHRAHVGRDHRPDGLVPPAEHAADLGAGPLPRAATAAARRGQPVDRHRIVVAHGGAPPRTTGRRRQRRRRRRARSATRSTRSGSRRGRHRRRRRDHDLARRQVPEQRRRPARIELGQHVVEHEHRRRAGALGDQAVGGQAQRQRQRALLALRGVGARRQAADRQRRPRRGADRRSTRRA